MGSSGYSRLGEILIASGDITQQQLSAALARQKVGGGRLGQILVEEGHVSAEQVARALALQFDYPCARFDNFPVDTEALGAVPEEAARTYVVCPLRKLGGELYCATADPIDTAASDEVERISDCNLHFLIATEQEILDEIDRRYGTVSGEASGPTQLGPNEMFLHYRLVAVRWDEPAVLFFDAEDKRLLRRVTLAIVKPSDDSHVIARGQRFLEHSMWLARFPHRNVLTVHDVGEFEGVRFVVSEALTGETLAERLSRERRFPLSMVGRIALRLCDTLRHLHGYQLVYQALSPRNVVILPNDEIRLTHLDVRLNPNEYDAYRDLPADEYRYLSPEQLTGEPLDTRSDIFSLGSLIYEMATGRAAFPGPSVAAVTQLLREGAVLAAEELPIELNRLILRSCAKERHARYPDVDTLKDELETLTWPEVVAGAGLRRRSA